ncbi:paxillin isoform X7 [Octopus sinensis]|uniref:Paxillin isoform X7 n=1 Tax=Octopus sinensis TaxID=2607531 RepID=A0A6P7TMU7_9MOLL|nr:paxillin isoform X7 [Octopus sinensis]
MLNYKQRVMEDLDALLADLQSTTAHISSFQQQQAEQEQYQNRRPDIVSSQSSPRTSTPSPLPSQLTDHNDTSQLRRNDKAHGCPSLKQHIVQENSTHHHHHHHLHHHQQQQQQQQHHHSYSSERTSSSSSNSGATYHQERSSASSTLSQSSLPGLSPVGYNKPIGSGSVSSGSNSSLGANASSQMSSTINSNLSELDQLLQDLNSAHFLDEVNRRTNSNQSQFVNGNSQRVVTSPGQVPSSTGSQPVQPPVAPKPNRVETNNRANVDAMLHELDHGVPPPPAGRQMAGVNSAATTVGQHAQIGGQVYGQNATYIQQPLYQETPMMSPQTASTATRELDELMASLSEFRVSNRDNSVAQQVAGGDPAYARPHKIRNESAGTATSAATSSMSATSMTAKGDQLDSMLGSLQSDMNRQGVSTKTKGLCAACNKPVVSQMITALGKVWHVEHFTCAHCTMTLGTMSFYERDNKAYCEKDYHSLFAPRCAYCNGPIVDKCVTALDKTWHPEHFFCGLCGRNFGDEGFHERDGQAYCREDFLKMFAPKCGGCAQPIKDSYISALNRHWHPDCFVCWQCQVPFGNTSFFDHDGLPYCEQHYHAKRGSLCSDCQQPITGPSIIAMGRKFHPKHFTCAFCRKQLNNVTFKEQNEKPYCHPCFSKLFAGTKMMD